MTITISESVYSEGYWTVVAIVDGPNGTFVGPFLVDQPEDAAEAQLIAAIQSVL